MKGCHSFIFSQQYFNGINFKNNCIFVAVRKYMNFFVFFLIIKY